MERQRRRFDWFTMFLMLACGGLTVLTLLLARDNRMLKSRAADETTAAEAKHQELQATGFHPGDAVDPLPVVDESGQPATIRFGGGESKTILFVFSEGCPACKETLPRWTQTLAHGFPPVVRVLAVQTDGHHDASTNAVRPFPYPTFTNDPGSGLMARVPMVPAAFVIDAKGIVTKVWFGVPTQEDEEALRRELTVS